MLSKHVQLRGQSFSRDQWPLICTPLIGADVEQLVEQASLLTKQSPDIIEWRIDFFSSLTSRESVSHALQLIRRAIGDIPLLVTRRSINEGGEAIPLNEEQVLSLYLHLVDSDLIDAIDYEISLPESNWLTLSQACSAKRVLLIGSYHCFENTPEASFIIDKLAKAEQLGADIAKAAVMPTSKADVIELLSITERADQLLSIPVITMSMAELGLSTRLIGSCFGSCLTFAVGLQVSAPGQVPIEDVKAVVSVLRKHHSTDA